MISTLRQLVRIAPKGLPTGRSTTLANTIAIQSRMVSKCSKCTGCVGCAGKRNISTQKSDSNIAELRDVLRSEVGSDFLFDSSVPSLSVSAATKVGSSIEVTFSNGEKHRYPNVWLRDNCQCVECFDPKALGRSFLMSNLDLKLQVRDLTVNSNGGVEIIWEDGHKSSCEGKWLQERSFSESARSKYRYKYQLPKTLWGKGYDVSKWDYPTLMNNDVELLKWLVKQESHGATVLENTPGKPEAAMEFAERIAKVKYTHFGDYSNVVNHPETNNLAYTNKKLNLHNDMPQYSEIPGLIFLHMIKQHEGHGGDTVISDGFNAAEQMRQQHPKEFEKLCKTDVYFWDLGDAKDKLEMKQFYKINKGPTIQCDNKGNITTIRFNNQVRDSFLDLPAEEIEEFYNALKIYFDLMYENSVSFKMSNGQMTILDNIRCQHAREAFTGDISARHLATTFMAWDEALCRRRRLQKQFELI